MVSPIKALALTTVLTSTAFLALESEAKATNNYYGLACVTNRTSAAITYSYSWNGREWHSMSALPGYRRSHSFLYDYANENRSPSLHIRFDTDLTRTIDLVEYVIPSQEIYAAPTTNCNYHGNDFVFEYVYDGSYIDLMEW